MGARLISGCLVLAASLSLTACGSGSSDSKTDSAANSKAASAKSLKDFGTMDDLVKAAEKEGQLNVIALPHDWANYGDVIAAFKKKYPKIKVNEANPNASSKEEIQAATTNKGTNKAPDVFDLGANVATENASMFAPYKVAAFDKLPTGVGDSQARFYPDYTGIMTIGWNKTKFGEINSLDDLLNGKFKGTVALNGKPAEAGAAFGGYQMVNFAKGGDLKNQQPALDFFKKLKDAGNLTTVDVTNATIDSGQTGVVMDWSYNQASTQKRLKEKGVDWQYKTLPGAEAASYYNQAINKDAPHPAAARLWQEFLYSPEAQNIWMKGGATPSLLDSMKADGTVDKAALAAQVKVSGKPKTWTPDEAKTATTWLQSHWDQAIGN